MPELPSEWEKTFQHLYNEGHTLQTIEDHLGILKSTAEDCTARLRQEGLIGRRWEGKHTTKELADRLIALCAAGQSQGEIGAALDMHPDAVMYHIVRLQKAGRLLSRYAYRFRPRPNQQRQWQVA